MEKLTLYQKQIGQLLLVNNKKLASHPLVKKIDHWEYESIMKIQQTAKNLREEFKEIFTKYTLELNKIYVELTNQIEKLKVENQLEEKHIQSYLNQLNQLKKDYQKPQTINIQYESINHENLFIKKMKLSQISVDTFHQPMGDIQIINKTHTILHGLSNNDAIVCGMNEYSTGIHRFRFLIEKLGIPKWIFFGIISQNFVSDTNLIRNASVYGWAGHHQVWLNGMHHHQYDGYRMEMDVNHIIQLVIDCNQQKIGLINETTGMKHEINVSLLKCPFPWILYLGLYGINDRIRLLLA